MISGPNFGYQRGQIIGQFRVFFNSFDKSYTFSGKSTIEEGYEIKD